MLEALLVAGIVSVAPTLAALVSVVKLFRVGAENEAGHERVEAALARLEAEDAKLRANIAELHIKLNSHIAWEETDKWDALLGSVSAIHDRLTVVEEEQNDDDNGTGT